MIKQLAKIPYEQRRKAFLKKLGKNQVAVFASPPESETSLSRSTFRQDTQLYYLTGFEETECIALFATHLEHGYQLFVRPKDKLKELWDGKIEGVQAARTKYGADAAFSSQDQGCFNNAFINAMAEAEGLHYRLGKNETFDRRILKLLEQAKRKIGRTGRPLWSIHDPEDIIGDLRLIKSKEEIDRLRVVTEFSADAICEVMRNTRAGISENEIEGILLKHYRTMNSPRPAYAPIVASGSNACVLHYSANNRTSKNGDLVLIDAGAEYEYLNADITRTFPVNGRYTKEQKEIYLAVLKAQKDTIKLAKPGATIQGLHEHATDVLIEELKKLKLLKGPSKAIKKSLEYRKYYPHSTGHFLGMDVHDIGKYYMDSMTVPRKLKPGMVFTVEPGLYFSDPKSPAKYKGIGVRIEDDVVITSKGCEVLTQKVPKEIDEIEALCNLGD